MDQIFRYSAAAIACYVAQRAGTYVEEVLIGDDVPDPSQNETGRVDGDASSVQPVAVIDKHVPGALEGSSNNSPPNTVAVMEQFNSPDDGFLDSTERSTDTNVAANTRHLQKCETGGPSMSPSVATTTNETPISHITATVENGNIENHFDIMNVIEENEGNNRPESAPESSTKRDEASEHKRKHFKDNGSDSDECVDAVDAVVRRVLARKKYKKTNALSPKRAKKRRAYKKSIKRRSRRAPKSDSSATARRTRATEISPDESSQEQFFLSSCQDEAIASYLLEQQNTGYSRPVTRARRTKKQQLAASHENSESPPLSPVNSRGKGNKH